MAEPYDITAYPPFAVTVDLVVLVIRDGELQVLTIKRGNEPFEGKWALPGGFVKRPPGNRAESLDEAAARELREETCLSLQKVPYLAQLGAYGDPGRDPRGNVVTVAYLVAAAHIPRLRAGGDAAAVGWLPARVLEHSDLAFDHVRIVDDAIRRVRDLIQYTALATAFLPTRFSLSDLRRVYEIVWGLPPNTLRPDNFHHKMTLAERKQGWLQVASDGQRPAILDSLGLDIAPRLRMRSRLESGDSRAEASSRRGRPPRLYEAGPTVQAGGPMTPLEGPILNPQTGETAI